MQEVEEEVLFMLVGWGWWATRLRVGANAALKAVYAPCHFRSRLSLTPISIYSTVRQVRQFSRQSSQAIHNQFENCCRV